jgi:hypothetical protein
MHAVKKALLNETREIPDGQARNEGRSATGSIRLPDIEKPSDALSGTVRAAAKYSVAAPKPDATAMLSASPQQTNTAAAPVAPQNSSASSSDPNRGKIEASADRVYGDINQMKLKSYTQDSVIEILERERASVTKDIEKTGASIHTVSALRRTELGSHLAQNHWDNLEGGKKDPATINIRSGLQPDGKGPSASGTLEAGLPKNTGAHTAPSRAVATPKTDRRLGG